MKEIGGRAEGNGRDRYVRDVKLSLAIKSSGMSKRMMKYLVLLEDMAEVEIEKNKRWAYTIQLCQQPIRVRHDTNTLSQSRKSKN